MGPKSGNFRRCFELEQILFKYNFRSNTSRDVRIINWEVNPPFAIEAKSFNVPSRKDPIEIVSRNAGTSRDEPRVLTVHRNVIVNNNDISRQNRVLFQLRYFIDNINSNDKYVQIQAEEMRCLWQPIYEFIYESMINFFVQMVHKKSRTVGNLIRAATNYSKWFRAILKNTTRSNLLEIFRSRPEHFFVKKHMVKQSGIQAVDWSPIVLPDFPIYKIRRKFSCRRYKRNFALIRQYKYMSKVAKAQKGKIKNRIFQNKAMEAFYSESLDHVEDRVGHFSFNKIHASNDNDKSCYNYNTFNFKSFDSWKTSEFFIGLIYTNGILHYEKLLDYIPFAPHQVKYMTSEELLKLLTSNEYCFVDAMGFVNLMPKWMKIMRDIQYGMKEYVKVFRHHNEDHYDIQKLSYFKDITLLKGIVAEFQPIDQIITRSKNILKIDYKKSKQLLIEGKSKIIFYVGNTMQTVNLKDESANVSLPSRAPVNGRRCYGGKPATSMHRDGLKGKSKKKEGTKEIKRRKQIPENKKKA